MKHKIIEAHHDGYTMSTDPAKLDAGKVRAFLATSHWAEGIPLETVGKALQNSLCFGLYRQGEQVGLARVVTDYATFAYLCDVYVLKEHRGKGLGQWLVECVMTHPELQNLRRFTLATKDAHGVYARFGFAPPGAPERMMERHDPDVYKRLAAAKK